MILKSIQTAAAAQIPEEMAAMLETCDRQAAGPTAPAKGLTLVGMRYPEYPELLGPFRSL